MNPVQSVCLPSYLDHRYLRPTKLVDPVLPRDGPVSRILPTTLVF